jgi:hypothetical protein
MNRCAVPILAVVLASPAAWALTIDAKALARYDNSYLVCEAAIPAMRGHRDEAYLSLWRAKADAANRAQLAQTRKSTAYQSERSRILQAGATTAASAASSPIKQECQALWGEAQKFVKAKP